MFEIPEPGPDGDSHDNWDEDPREDDAQDDRAASWNY